MPRLGLALLVVAGVALGLVMPPAADARACARVVNPYPDTRYEGVDLTRIRADGVSCRTARRVARGAHRKALGITPTSARFTFGWRRWTVTGDLAGDHDRYSARRGGDRVRWRF